MRWFVLTWSSYSVVVVVVVKKYAILKWMLLLQVKHTKCILFVMCIALCNFNTVQYVCEVFMCVCKYVYMYVHVQMYVYVVTTLKIT
jgi:hypothetical protein